MFIGMFKFQAILMTYHTLNRFYYLWFIINYNMKMGLSYLSEVFAQKTWNHIFSSRKTLSEDGTMSRQRPRKNVYRNMFSITIPCITHFETIINSCHSHEFGELWRSYYFLWLTGNAWHRARLCDLWSPMHDMLILYCLLKKHGAGVRYVYIV